jgi:NAD(P)-dependent dehydrogenase (short-subunit alcohol dehydrogenase family)
VAAVFEVNVFGIVRATRAALPHLRRSDRPSESCVFGQ